MNTGMLWLDNDPKTALTAKIQKAADYYRDKYGRVPDTCMVRQCSEKVPPPKAGLPFARGGMCYRGICGSEWKR